MSDTTEVQAIDKEIADLQAKRKSILEGKRKEALQQARALVETYAFSAAELGLGKTVGAKAGGTQTKKRAPKYANPKNPAQTYGGGAKPLWLKEYEANGGKLADLLIKK